MQMQTLQTIQIEMLTMVALQRTQDRRKAVEEVKRCITAHIPDRDPENVGEAYLMLMRSMYVSVVLAHQKALHPIDAFVLGAFDRSVTFERSDLDEAYEYGANFPS